MGRDYKTWVRGESAPIVRWLPTVAVLALALTLALHLLEPRTVVVQVLEAPDTDLVLRLERKRYARQDNWSVRVREGHRWRTLFYWVPDARNAESAGLPPRLEVIHGATNKVILRVGERAVWGCDRSGRTMALPDATRH